MSPATDEGPIGRVDGSLLLRFGLALHRNLCQNWPARFAARRYLLEAFVSSIASMPHLEIWRSQPTWLQAAKERQRSLLQELTRIVRRLAEPGDESCGPFHCASAHDHVLVWQVRLSEAQTLRREVERIGLPTFFELLLYDDAGRLSAREYAKFLAQKWRLEDDCTI